MEMETELVPQGIQNVLTILANTYLEVLSQMCLEKFPLKLWINKLEKTVQIKLKTKIHQ